MKKLLCLFVLALAFAACKKEKDASAFEGTYEGTFRITTNGKVATNKAKVMFAGKRYTSLKGKGNGTFNFEDMGGNPVINFSDQNVWTADFDWGLILSGQFEYKTKGDSLILTRVLPYTPANITQNFYQYRLKRTR